MTENIKLLEISLNYKGNGIKLFVDEDTANILLNDPVQAENYLERLFNSNESENQNENKESLNPVQAENYLERLFNSNESENQNENKESLNMLWSSKGKPSIKDTEATDFFLMLRQKYASQFDDKKTCKNKIWQRIATEMEENNFKLGKNGAEKCRQKFQNLLKLYLKQFQIFLNYT
ncbi:Myb/SANT-like DNA-binding domain [Popillia japonica]|uniref:Myb/SANT-like DNA-binding domain n=1 Tax=Popillia japonica TaxID=7064 RepID=A0AAW1HSW0_POPJA